MLGNLDQPRQPALSNGVVAEKKRRTGPNVEILDQKDSPIRNVGEYRRVPWPLQLLRYPRGYRGRQLNRTHVHPPGCGLSGSDANGPGNRHNTEQEYGEHEKSCSNAPR